MVSVIPIMLFCRRSKPLKDQFSQFYDNIFPREYLDDGTDDEEEEIPLPTQEKVDQLVDLLDFFNRVINGRGFIECGLCLKPLYDSMDLNSHMFEEHTIRKTIEHPRVITDEDKIFHKHLQEEVFFNAPKVLAKEAAKKGQSVDLILYGRRKSKIKIVPENEDASFANDLQEINDKEHVEPCEVSSFDDKKMEATKTVKPVAQLQNVYCKKYGVDGQVELWKQNDFTAKSSETRITDGNGHANLEASKRQVQDASSNDKVSKTDDNHELPIDFNDLENNLMLVTNERDFLAHDVEELEHKQEIAEDENSCLVDSLVIAANERDLLEEENENLITQRDFLADDYDNLVDQNQSIEEDHAILLEVNHQRQRQVQDQIAILWDNFE